MGRRCSRELGFWDIKMVDIFLFPFEAFKWLFSLAFWWYLLVIITSTDTYYDVADKLKEKWNEYKFK